MEKPVKLDNCFLGKQRLYRHKAKNSVNLKMPEMPEKTVELKVGIALQDSKGGPAAGSTAAIDRSLGLPLYVQLANILRRQINEGLYLPGDQLPSEAMLVQAYKVSPMTVRRAINLLAEQNVVVAFQGKGTFVNTPRLSAAAFYLNHLQEIFSNPSTAVKLLEAKFKAADEEIAQKLNIKRGDHTVYIRRLILTEGRPAFCHRGYLVYDPRRPVIESELEVTVLQGLFSGTASPLIKKGDLRMESILLPEEDAALLGIKTPAAGFRLEHLFYDFDDRPASWGYFTCPGDRLRLQATIGLNMPKEFRNEKI